LLSQIQNGGEGDDSADDEEEMLKDRGILHTSGINEDTISVSASPT